MRSYAKDLLALVAFAPIAIFACHTRTALDVQSCFESSVANAAGPILGSVAGVVLSSSSADDAKTQMLGIATASGTAAALCALDTILHSLGHEPNTPAALPNNKMARTATPVHNATQIAIARGHELRIFLFAKK